LKPNPCSHEIGYRVSDREWLIPAAILNAGGITIAAEDEPDP
jgi:hypothetical protein